MGNNCFIVEGVKASKAWLVGRINGQLFNRRSNIYNLFAFMDSLLFDFAKQINASLNSSCICSVFFNAKRKEQELGIPNSIFNNRDSHYYFDYTLPLYFGDKPNVDILNERKKDIFVASTLMKSNSFENFTAIGKVYCVNIEIEQSSFSVECGFPYEFPLIFCDDGKSDLDRFGSSCSFPYIFPLPFLGNCSIFPYMQDGKKVGIVTTIIIYTDNNIYFDKLSEIYKALSPIDTSLEIIRRDESLKPCLSKIDICP